MIPLLMGMAQQFMQGQKPRQSTNVDADGNEIDANGNPKGSYSAMVNNQTQGIGGGGGGNFGWNNNANSQNNLTTLFPPSQGGAGGLFSTNTSASTTNANGDVLGSLNNKGKDAGLFKSTTGGLDADQTAGNFIGQAGAGLLGLGGNMLQQSMSKTFSTGDQSSENLGNQIGQIGDANMPKTMQNKLYLGPRAGLDSVQAHELQHKDPLEMLAINQGMQANDSMSNLGNIAGEKAFDAAKQQNALLTRQTMDKMSGAGANSAQLSAALRGAGQQQNQGLGGAYSSLVGGALQARQAGNQAMLGGMDMANNLFKTDYETLTKPHEMSADPTGALNAANQTGGLKAQQKNQDTWMPGNAAMPLANSWSGLLNRQAGINQFNNNNFG